MVKKKVSFRIKLISFPFEAIFMNYFMYIMKVVL